MLCIGMFDLRSVDEGVSRTKEGEDESKQSSDTE
jgi:hypothetical protein